MIDPLLLEILACPSCKEPLREEGESLLCANRLCGLRYPVRDGIPILLVEEARKPHEDSSRAGADKKA